MRSNSRTIFASPESSASSYLVDAEHEQGTAVMLITHEMAAAERAQRRLRIMNGVVSLEPASRA